MSDATKAVMGVAVGTTPPTESTIRKEVMYLAVSSELYVPPRRIVHGRIRYGQQRRGVG